MNQQKDRYYLNVYRRMLNLTYLNNESRTLLELQYKELVTEKATSNIVTWVITSNIVTWGQSFETPNWQRSLTVLSFNKLCLAEKRRWFKKHCFAECVDQCNADGAGYVFHHRQNMDQLNR